MKNTFKGFTIKMAGKSFPVEMEFKLDEYSLEYDVAELAQFAANFATVLGAIKDTVKELTPIVVNGVNDADARRQEVRDVYDSRRNEREKEMILFRHNLEKSFAQK